MSGQENVTIKPVITVSQGWHHVAAAWRREDGGGGAALLCLASPANTCEDATRRSPC